MPEDEEVIVVGESYCTIYSDALTCYHRDDGEMFLYCSKEVTEKNCFSGDLETDYKWIHIVSR